MKLIEVKKPDNAAIEAQTNGNVIETQINGEFKGWEGETIFKNLNGQIWQQSSYAYMYHYIYSPSVLICKSGNASKMRVEG